MYRITQFYFQQIIYTRFVEKSSLNASLPAYFCLRKRVSYFYYLYILLLYKNEWCLFRAPKIEIVTEVDVFRFQKKVQPWKLYSMVSGLLVIDFVIMFTWQLLDPLQRRIETFPLEAPVSALDDAEIRPELEHCESQNNNVWLSIIYAYKGLVLVSQ